MVLVHRLPKPPLSPSSGSDCGGSEDPGSESLPDSAAAPSLSHRLDLSQLLSQNPTEGKLINDRSPFLSARESGKPTTKVLADLTSGEDPPPGCSLRLQAVSSHGRRDKDCLSVVSFTGHETHS